MTMLVSCAFAAPTLAFADPTVYEVGNSKEFDNAVAGINEKTDGDYVIKLTDDIELPSASFSSGCTTTILGNGHTITLGEGETHFGVSRGAHLNLGSTDGRDRLTISGGNNSNNDSPAVLQVEVGGTCNMYSGVTICDREGNNYPGGGVTVQGGTFHMYGGTIKHCGMNGGSVCYGGGVGVVDDYYTGTGGTFIMDGGEIKGCYAIAPSVPGLTFQSYGGGVFVAYGSSFTMNGGTISGNRADVGGGVMLSDNSAEMKIGGGSITGNTATICGGGLAAVRNDGAVVVNGTKLCNNVADGAASDVYLANTPAQLSPAGNMGENYLGAPDDVYGSRIDGWYVDNEDSRYASQQAGERKAFADYNSIGASGSVSLVAASNNRLVKVSFTNEDGSVTYGEGWYEPGTKADKIQVPKPAKDSDDTFDYEFAGWDSEIADVTVEAVYKAQFNRLLKVFGARYEFKSATPGQQLPDEVLALLPADGTRYSRGSEIGALAPSQTSVETADGTWTFVGYDRTTAEASMDNADNEGNVHFSGAWKFTRKATPAQPGDGGATAGANPAGKADGASLEGAQLPQTSDAFDPGALLALIAAGATSLIVAAAIRE